MAWHYANETQCLSKESKDQANCQIWSVLAHAYVRMQTLPVHLTQAMYEFCGQSAPITVH